LTDSGNYEFYDGPGFDQLSGGALKVISNAEITAWRRQLAAKKQAEEAAAAAKKQADDAAAAAKKQADDEAAAAKKKSDEQAAEAKRAADSELQKQQQAGNDCDRLATNSTDANRNRNVEGVSYELLLTQIDAAIDACSNAVQQWPNELRYQFQLGRAYQKKDWKKASVIFSAITSRIAPPLLISFSGAQTTMMRTPWSI
jgi:hypothetical protein